MSAKDPQLYALTKCCVTENTADPQVCRFSIFVVLHRHAAKYKSSLTVDRSGCKLSWSVPLWLQALSTGMHCTTACVCVCVCTHVCTWVCVCARVPFSAVKVYEDIFAMLCLVHADSPVVRLRTPPQLVRRTVRFTCTACLCVGVHVLVCARVRACMCVDSLREIFWTHRARLSCWVKWRPILDTPGLGFCPATLRFHKELLRSPWTPVLIQLWEYTFTFVHCNQIEKKLN